MTRMRQARIFFMLGAMTSCTLPPFEYEGEHVVVASNYKVCSGTLESFDRAVVRIDQRLGREATDDLLQIAILGEAESDRLNLCETCRTSRNGGLVVLAPFDVEKDAAHEMVHDRVRAIRGGNVPLFDEGIAVAVAPSVCQPDGVPPTLDELLAVQTPWEFSPHGYHAGGELVAWLLDQHGPELFLKFHATLTRPEAATRASNPEFVRASYRAHFGTELDDDIFAHTRTPEQLTPEQLGCTAPTAPMQADRIHLQANLDCDSTRVETDFRRSNYGFVNWTLDVPETATPRRYRLLDRLPEGTSLKIVRCACDLDVAGERSTWTGDSNVGANIELEPGTYMVRWQGPLDDGIELDVEIEAYDAG
jgi:hypothetical protein